mmetsp:Transcript_45083/g.107140  ORF Transcript_45083/g.107140 Transcript_45083/m.107140 type:complete len:623 (+) Transcript_45083:122-1990(+)
MFRTCRTKFERRSTRDFETPDANIDVVKVEPPPKVQRLLSLPKGVSKLGGVDQWNEQTLEQKALVKMVSAMCTATTKEEALVQVTAMIELGHHLWAYMYMRMLASKNLDVYYEVMLSQPSYLLPVMYTPTVGEVCQKFGMLPFYRRGCYLSIADKGNLKAVLAEYANAELPKGSDGKPLCDCIVFSDGGRILGLGDLGAWGMGIPLGKLDLYTVCGGVNPHRTIPLIIDAGCSDSSGNTAHLEVRDHALYTGDKRERVMCRSNEGTLVNCAYYGEDSMIKEFFDAAGELFGRRCLLQFEDFNSNDAFPLLAQYREKYLTYNDDIQGTAAVAVAGIMGAIKIKKPSCTDLIGALKQETFLFHGAGSANLGALQLLAHEAGVDKRRLMVTNSRGLIWKSECGKEGSYRNDEQKEFAVVGEPDFNGKDLVSVIKHMHPSCIIGAVGVAPNCFTKDVIDTMMEINMATEQERPIVFALSNPKSQAEITAENAYMWSQGEVIFGSGTYFDPVTVKGRSHSPGQVNNVYIFPGVSFGAISCQAAKIPDSVFLKAAEAVANSLNEDDIQSDRVIPIRDRVRDVALNVATAVVLECQSLSLAGKTLGKDEAEVKKVLEELMWRPGKDALS